MPEIKLITIYLTLDFVWWFANETLQQAWVFKILSIHGGKKIKALLFHALTLNKYTWAKLDIKIEKGKNITPKKGIHRTFRESFSSN